MKTYDHPKNTHYALKTFQLEHLENLCTAAQYWNVYEIFLNSVAPKSTVLDWGCGDGHFSFFLLDKEFSTHSFNVNNGDSYNPDGCKLKSFLRSKFKDSFKFQISTQGPTHLPYEDESFDAVVSLGVLEHVEQFGGNLPESLNEIHRILKKNGKFLCFHFPNKYSWIEALAKRIPSKHHHPYLFTKKEIYQLNRNAGFTVKELNSYGILPRNEFIRMPDSIKNSIWFVNFYNFLDRLLCSVFPILCQNYYFISRKPKQPDE